MCVVCIRRLNESCQHVIKHYEFDKRHCKGITLLKLEFTSSKTKDLNKIAMLRVQKIYFQIEREKHTSWQHSAHFPITFSASNVVVWRM